MGTPKTKNNVRKMIKAASAIAFPRSNTHAFAEAELLVYEPQLSRQHSESSDPRQTITSKP